MNTFFYHELKGAAQALALRITNEAQAAVNAKGSFSIVLSGGSTPRLLYEILAAEFINRIAWDRVQLYWSDERCVPPVHPDSNYGMAFEALLSKVPVLPQNIHRIPAEIAPPEKAAELYEKELRLAFGGAPGPGSTTFDVVLLGVGPDGHTASLFPRSPVLEERGRWAAAVQAPAVFSIKDRISLTLPAINGATDVFFFTAIEGKEDALQEILGGSGSSILPAARVRPRHEPVWFLAGEGGRFRP
jgi:6-phosphogluconolactonase